MTCHFFKPSVRKRLECHGLQITVICLTIQQGKLNSSDDLSGHVQVKRRTLFNRHYFYARLRRFCAMFTSWKMNFCVQVTAILGIPKNCSCEHMLIFLICLKILKNRSNDIKVNASIIFENISYLSTKNRAYKKHSNLTNKSSIQYVGTYMYRAVHKKVFLYQRTIKIK